MDLADRLYGCAPGLWTFQRCEKCGTAYLDPRPTPDTIGDAYREYYTHSSVPDVGSQTAGPIAEWRRALRHGYLNRRFSLSLNGASRLGPVLVPLIPGLASRQRQWARLPRPHTGAPLLDVGAGSGAAVAHFLRLGWDALGIDVDGAAVAAARSAHLPVTQGEITGLPGAERFAAVTMGHSIEHIHEPTHALAAAYRLLRPAGVLQLITPNAGSLGRRVFNQDWLGLDPPRHLVLFTPRALTVALRAAGFRRIRFRRAARPAAWYFCASEALRRGQPWTAAVTPSPRARSVLTFSRWFSGILPRLAEELVVTAVKPAR